MTATLHGRWAVVGALLLLATGAARAQPKQQPETDSAGAKALAAKIDERFAKHWQDKKVQPAPEADDAEFLRRVYLDLAGRIPSAGEASRFLDDKAPDKRQRLVENLLDSPAYVNHWANVWRPLLLPELKTRTAVPSFFETWLRTQLKLNVPYDQMARDLLTTPIDGLLAAGDVVFVPPSGKPSALEFYAFKKAKPEVLAGSTARLFLGVRIECAQCHDHPFAEWKQEQFWEYAAFFAGLEAPGDPRLTRGFRENTSVRKIAIADTDKVATARFLDSSEPKLQDNVGGRQVLADWVTSPKNPYFARAAANRLWAYFLGAGLVEPVDEMVGKVTQDNDPGGLLDELAKDLVAHDFDLKFLMRAITASKVYQLTSARTHASLDDPRMFPRMAIRGLTGEQLFDSLTQATGYRGGSRAEFLSKFTDRGEKPTEAQTSIQQALALMNGKYVAGATSLSQSPTLAALTDFPLMTTAERVEALYLATLSRRPRPAELDRMVKYVQQAGEEAQDKDTASARALTDVLWMLLNCAEFKVNH
jgi:Protein of unknown function (DUF1549)/Protein of unknown function (DUF1553)